VNDPRVEVWNSTKTAALLTSVQSNPRVFLNLDFEAGHGIGSTKNQRNRERADIYSFMLWQFGVAKFQPQ
jgi:prolyl oligopeptidase